MSCGDLCTAAKCEELEARIADLEQSLELLLASFNTHTNQSIPEAHQYQPEVNVNTDITENGELITEVTIDLVSDSSVLILPDSVTPSVTMDIFKPNSGEYVFKVGVNGQFDEDTLIIEPPETVENTDENIESNLNINGSFYNNILNLTVADGQSQSSVNIPINIESSTLSEHVQSNLRISSSFRNDILTISVADGESQDTAQVFIDTNSSPQTIFITEEVYMNCDELERLLTECCDSLSNEINNSRNIIIAEIQDAQNSLVNEIDSAENIINNNLRDVTDKVEIIDAAVTVDISGTVNTEYSCQFPLTEDLIPIPDYAKSVSKEAAYTGIGLVGLHENLKLINDNLDSIHSDICKAVDPISRITSDDLYRFCNNSDIERSDFAEGTAGDERYAEAIQAYLTDLIADSKYGYLLNFLNEETGNLLINAPNNWITPMLADFSLIQSRINNAAICAIEPSETGDVVSIVASDKVIARAEGKFLVLHFVELTNYPKRSRNSSYWQIQIPAAKEAYEWQADFELLRWHRGNQYAELRFNEFSNPVSGWFEDAEAANSYFNAVLNLTTATEKNRVIPSHSNPNTAVTQRQTRPYRAFISSVDPQGNAVCHVKYVPPIDSNNG